MAKSVDDILHKMINGVNNKACLRPTHVALHGGYTMDTACGVCAVCTLCSIIIESHVALKRLLSTDKS